MKRIFAALWVFCAILCQTGCATYVFSSFREGIVDERHAFSERVIDSPNSRDARVETIQTGYRIEDQVISGVSYRRYVFEGILADEKAMHILIPDAFLSFDGEQAVASQVAALNRRAIVQAGENEKPIAPVTLFINKRSTDISNYSVRRRVAINDTIILHVASRERCRDVSCYSIGFLRAGEDVLLDEGQPMAHEFPTTSELPPRRFREVVYRLTSVGFLVTVSVDVVTSPLQLVGLFVIVARAIGGAR